MEPIRSVSRAVAVVDAIAQSGPSGARLADVVTATGLQKTTAHRIVTTLLELGWIEQEEESAIIHLGMPLVGLGAVALNRHGLLDIASPRLQALAEGTGDTVFLSVRRGVDAVCVDRLTGSFPVRTLTLGVGDRRPLGVGAGSLALLAWLEDKEIAHLLTVSSKSNNSPSLPSEVIRKSVEQSRDDGFTTNRGGIVPGTVGVGVPVFGLKGETIASLSVGAVESRLQRQRLIKVVALLKDQAKLLAEDLHQVTGGATDGRVRRFLVDDD